MDEALKAKMKELALDTAEESLLLAFKQIKAFGKLVVESSPNSYDNILFNGVLLLEAELLKAIDKIDNKVG